MTSKKTKKNHNNASKFVMNGYLHKEAGGHFPGFPDKFLADEDLAGFSDKVLAGKKKQRLFEPALNRTSRLILTRFTLFAFKYS